MTFSVYVGPYVKSYGARNGNERELLDSFDDILQEGRGESGLCDSSDNSLYVIPSEEVLDMNAHLGRVFSRDEADVVPVAVTPTMMRRQVEQMGNLANTFIAAVESCGGTCDVLWGVVCRMY